MSNESLYIHIEGMDLAGKSSTAREFVGRHPNEVWDIRRNSLSKTSRLRDLADEMLGTGEYSSDTVGTVYTAALMADIDTFRRPNLNTIQDSTILLRSIAFHAIKGNVCVLDLLESVALRHPKFDASFMLTASKEARLKRLEKSQDASAHDLMLVRDPASFFAMEKMIADLAVRHFDATIIDTSSRTVPEVVDQIEKSLK